ncbi:MAG: formylmethanofuran dehydrogenase subunit A [Pseudomonadota bacterium]
MAIKITGGIVYDPTHQIDGKKLDLYIVNDRILHQLPADEKVKQTYNLKNHIVMAGAIDIHTHIGGGKVNIARTMMLDDQIEYPQPGDDHRHTGCGHAVPSTFTAGYRYAEMGYTACFEPAVLPVNARQAHMEMADTPMVDKGGYVLLGNDDFLLSLMHESASQSTINDYVAWVLHASQCIGIKVVNAGGIHAFKYNQRRLDIDEQSPAGVTPRDIITTLSRAVHELGVPHPLHVHASNLGIAGNFKSTLATMAAAESLPIHLTHIQFHSYGNEGDYNFSSAACEIAEAINTTPNVTADVGQIMFGQTITTSGDTMMQYFGHEHAHPKKWTVMDIECEAGCGVIPFRYRNKSFVNALQWAIGLEIFLQVDDPWRVFLTTDHPNGAPFTTYPHLIKLLMNRSFRNDAFSIIHSDAQKMSNLASMEREYSLYEIAIMTRAAPAKILGLSDHGHLGEGASANITIYKKQDDVEQMFAKPSYVFKNGELVVKDGSIIKTVRGVTHTVKPDFDIEIEKPLKRYFDDYQTISLPNFKISADEMIECIGSEVVTHPCRI